MSEYIYCAVNRLGEIQTVMGSSKQTRYFKTAKYLKRAVEYHNRNRHTADDPWRVQKFELKEVDNDNV